MEDVSSCQDKKAHINLVDLRRLSILKLYMIFAAAFHIEYVMRNSGGVF